MDPHVVFMCQKVLPNPFVLTIAAAARAHALNAGAEPRVTAANASTAEIALQEIANGAFANHELAPFLTDQMLAAKLAAPAVPRTNSVNVGVSGPTGGSLADAPVH
ncbi:DNA-directed RNA polymerase subunit omega [Pseudorhizobium tarimense]|uniref:DNA-directed RNA polymerase subunit omega n=1 Tax=Pseudorhizobium tarimense TaxID=1079109 RepID=A0ABV2HDI8_9HYPH|nr:DNA-directed RNA polymerase subunit omega [Pseudorhizobium tarimense]MCJ8521604.1 DNA-directed RNA polymerase subunit omega [Pseudorhizobium tarimense]